MFSSLLPLRWVGPNSSQAQALLKPSNHPLGIPNRFKIVGISISKSGSYSSVSTLNGKIRAALDDAQTSAGPVLVQDDKKDLQLSEDIAESVRVLKNAAKTRKVPVEDILSAFSVLDKAKLDPSGFLETLGGTESPGRNWMLIFTAEKKLDRGKYFPITAVQRFDAAGRRIENGVYLGPVGSLTFEGRFSWKNRILAFIFERLRVTIGPLGPFDFNFKGKDEREPSNKDPFFIWFYIDEEIAVARGRSGGTAFWVRCKQVKNS